MKVHKNQTSSVVAPVAAAVTQKKSYQSSGTARILLLVVMTTIFEPVSQCDAGEPTPKILLRLSNSGHLCLRPTKITQFVQVLNNQTTKSTQRKREWKRLRSECVLSNIFTIKYEIDEIFTEMLCTNVFNKCMRESSLSLNLFRSLTTCCTRNALFISERTGSFKKHQQLTAGETLLFVSALSRYHSFSFFWLLQPTDFTHCLEISVNLLPCCQQLRQQVCLFLKVMQTDFLSDFFLSYHMQFTFSWQKR